MEEDPTTPAHIEVVTPPARDIAQASGPSWTATRAPGMKRRGPMSPKTTRRVGQRRRLDLHGQQVLVAQPPVPSSATQGPTPPQATIAIPARPKRTLFDFFVTDTQHFSDPKVDRDLPDIADTFQTWQARRRVRPRCGDDKLPQIAADAATMGTEADSTEHRALSGGDATDDADLAQAVFLAPNEGQPAAISDITAGVRRSQPSFGPGGADRRSTKRPRRQDVPV